jgi:hypothetical protein
MRILVLTPETFGGQGGIAKYTDLLTARCAHPRCTELVAIPRVVRDQSGSVAIANLTCVITARAPSGERER